MMGIKKSFLFSKSNNNPSSTSNSSDQIQSSSSSAKSSTSTSTSSSSSSSWPWAPTYYYCHHQPRTLSFRTTTSSDHPHPNSSDMPHSHSLQHEPEIYGPLPGPGPRNLESSLCLNSPVPADDDEDPGVESVIRGLKSERLFFSPGETSSSLLQHREGAGDLELVLEREGAVAVTVDSRDPLEDFKASMAEMVDAHGLRDWESLENLLTCYLTVNAKTNHAYIVGAFVDLLLGLFGAAKQPPTADVDVDVDFKAASESNCCCSHHHHNSNHYSPSSPLSFYTSISSSSSSSSEDSSSTPCVSSLEAYREPPDDDLHTDADEIGTPSAPSSGPDTRK